MLLGANLDANNIKEGIDVFFECNVLANPKVLELIWFFEDEILLSNVSAGIIVSNQTLVLQKVKRQNIGRYRCSASNSQGNSTSEGIYLKIKCKCLFLFFFNFWSRSNLRKKKRNKVYPLCI